MGKFKVVAAVSNMHLPNVKEIGTVVEPNHPGYISQEEFLGLVKSTNPDGIITFPMNKIDKEVLDLAPNLKSIATFSVGFDHIDREECKKRGVKVGYLPGILTECVAETAIALLLATARRIPQNVALARKWEQCWPEWHVFMFSGNQIEGSTVGIYGLGRIGTSVMEKLLPFHPNKIIYHDIIKKEGINAEYVSFEDLVAKSDFLIITVAVTGDAKGKFNKEILSKMKQGSILINTARGSVINSEDLYEALKSGHLGGAGLDVTDPEPLPANHPLFTLDNCVILPHIGSATIETRHKMLKLTEDNLINGLLGKEMPAPLPL